MDIVLTHNNMDFDALAAEFAVTKLHPTARMVLGYPLTGNVRNFISLYRSSLPILQIKYTDIEKIQRIFLVDCQHEERIDETARKLLFTEDKIYPVTIFDHHEPDHSGLLSRATPDSVVRAVGSATTLVVNELRKNKIGLSEFEATLLALGIYEDTGCLTYAGTCELDAQCIAYLFSYGVDLGILNDFLHVKMSDKQAELLQDLLKSSQRVQIHGSTVVIAQTSRPAFVDGLALLTRKLIEVETADAAFTVVRMRDRVHVVGRSDLKTVDARMIAREFGGDGHQGAASAVVRNGNVQLIVQRIKDILKAKVIPEKQAHEIMASPVRTVLPAVSMDEAGRIMTRYGQDGLIVVESGELLGVVSRRDVDQALHHKLGHAPVSGFMSRPVITVEPQTTLSKIQELMVREDIGRLPVMSSDNALIGIVSRNDVLRTLYGAKAPVTDAAAQTLQDNFFLGEHSVDDVCRELGCIDEATAWLCQVLGECAEQKGMVAYAVGGFVRDLLLRIPNFDLDFVVEGNAIEMAEAMEKEFPERLRVVSRHDRFQTATLEYKSENSTREVDFSTARTEFYEYPAALPTVEPSKLEQDLLRRDFTINALAVCLNPDRFGKLIDLFGGLPDLRSRIIRILHPFSFIEDPTRIVRAARFASRLGFTLEPKTAEQARRAIALGIFDNLGGVRLRVELQYILDSPHRLRGLDLLGQLGARLCYLDSELQYGPNIRKIIRWAERLLERYPVKQPWVVYLGLLISKLSEERVHNILDRLHTTNEQKLIIRDGLQVFRQLPGGPGRANSAEQLTNSQIYHLLNGVRDESLAIAACIAEPGSAVRRTIRHYLDKLEHTKSILRGADLIRIGLPQGPIVGEVLAKLLDARLDGLVKNRADEVEFVSRLGLSSRHS